MKQNRNARLALYIILNFIWMFLLYQGCIHLGARWGTALPYQICTGVYAAGAICAAVCWWIKTHPKDGAEPDRERAKIFLVWLFPILIVFFVDLFDLFILDSFRAFLSSVG